MKMKFLLLVLFMSQKAWTCQHGDIRFLSQEDPMCTYHGTVEVCLSGTWGTVCTNHWDNTDAGVACTQLGHPRYGAAAHYHGVASQPPIHLNNINCSGSELRVIDCPYYSQTSACFNNLAAVLCKPVVTGRPRNAAITVQSPTTLSVSWSSPPTTDSCRYISRYKVTCSGSSGSHSSNTQTANVLTLLMAGLRPYTRYSCCISAITTVDEGMAACIYISTPEAAPTAAPQIVRHSTGSTSLSFYWSPPPSGYQNGFIRYYRIRVTEATTNILKSSSTSINTQWSVSSLSPYTVYRCTVAAVTVAQGPSATITIQTKESAPTAAPQIVRHSTGSTSLSFYWSPPPSGYQNGFIRYYRIRVTEATTNILKSSSTSINTQWSVSSLSPYTVYRCTVAAVTVAQGPSATITIQTKESAPTAAPQIDSERSGATGSTSLSLYWSPPPSQQQNGRIRYYRINVTDETTSTHTLFTAYNTQRAISNLHPYTRYRCGVAAVTVAEGPSVFITIQTNQSVPTVAPTVNSTVRRNATTILITLQLLTHRESGGVITLYNITYRGFEPLNVTCSRSDSPISTTPAATYMDGTYVQLLINQLDPRLSYCLEVAAATSVGAGPPSEPIAVGLYSNDPFQVHLSSGALHCDHWLAYRPSSKWDEISQVVAEAIQGQCSCSFASEYIADGRLMCSGSDSVVFQGRIISTNSPSNRELLKYLQEWVQSTPTVIIEGVHLHISNCSVHLNEQISSLG